MGWEMVSPNRLGQKSQLNGIGNLIRLLVTGDCVLQHSQPDDAGLPVVRDDPWKPSDGGHSLDGLRVGKLLKDLHFDLAKLEPHVKSFCILFKEDRVAQVEGMVVELGLSLGKVPAV